MDTCAAQHPAAEVDPSPAQGLLREIEAIRRQERWDLLGDFLDRSYFAACLLVPEALDELLAAAPSVPQADPRTRLSRTFLQVDRPMPVQASVQFDRWFASVESPSLRDQVALELARVQQLTFDGRMELAEQCAERLAALLTSSPERQGIDDFLPVAQIVVGSAHLQAGNLDAAIGSYRTASRWAQVEGHPALEHADAFGELVDALREDGCPVAARRRLPLDRPRGARSSLLWIWTALAVLTRGLRALAAGDAPAAELALEAAGLARPQDDPDALGQYWWVPLHLRARLALLQGDREQSIHHLRRAMDDHYPSLGPDSYAGGLLRADHADLLQACGAYEEAALVLDQAERGLTLPQVVASRARLLWLTGEEEGLDALLERVSRYHATSSPELDVLRLRRRLERAPRRLRSPEDLELWRSVEQRAGDLALSLLPREAPSLLAEPGTTPRAVPAGPFVRVRTPVLSRGERELVEALREGDTMLSLAQRLFLSPQTVKTRLRDIYRKTGVHSKEELLRHRDTILRRPR